MRPRPMRGNGNQGTTRTYSRDNSATGSALKSRRGGFKRGVAGGRRVDALLRLCSNKLIENRRRLICDTVSPSPKRMIDGSEAASHVFSPEIYHFTSASDSDDFDKLQRSGSFINPKFTAKKPKACRPLRIRNAPTYRESSQDTILVEEESVLEMFPVKNKRKRVADEDRVEPPAPRRRWKKEATQKENEDPAYLAEEPSRKRPRKREPCQLTKKKRGGPPPPESSNIEIVGQRTKKTRGALPPTESSSVQVITDQNFGVELLEHEEQMPCAFSGVENRPPLASPPLPLLQSACGSPCVVGAVASVPSLLLQRVQQKFQSTPIEVRTSFQKFIPCFVSTIKRQDAGATAVLCRESPRGSPFLSKRRGTSSANSGPKSGDAYFSCAASQSSHTSKFVSAESGKQSQLSRRSGKTQDSETPDLFEDYSRRLSDPGPSRLPVTRAQEAHGWSRRSDSQARTGGNATLSLEHDGRMENRPPNATFPVYRIRAALADATVGCTRELQARFEEVQPEVKEEDGVDGNDDEDVFLPATASAGSVTSCAPDDADSDDDSVVCSSIVFGSSSTTPRPPQEMPLHFTVLEETETVTLKGTRASFKRLSAADVASTSGAYTMVSTAPRDSSANTPFCCSGRRVTFSDECGNKRNVVFPDPRVVLRRLSADDVSAYAAVNRVKAPGRRFSLVVKRLSSDDLARLRARAEGGVVEDEPEKSLKPRQIHGDRKTGMEVHSPEILRDAGVVHATPAVGRMSAFAEEEAVSAGRSDAGGQIDLPRVRPSPVVSPVFKIPQPPVRRSLNLRPSSIGSPSKMRHRSSMRLQPPKVPLPPGSISRVLVDENSVSNRTRRGRNKSSPLDDLRKSWKTAALLLSDPELTVRPEEATMLLAATSAIGTLAPFGPYATELVKQSAESKKIGEGTYGEVFCFTSKDGAKTVVKIAPTDGDVEINMALPKKALEMLMEVLMTGVLSDLRADERNRCSTFVRLQLVAYVFGRYPQPLIRLWDTFSREKGTENERPSKLPKDQRYVSMELAHGGGPLESFTMRNALQGVSVLEQVAAALGVAELAAEFEHRDLHWGNVLLEDIDDDDDENDGSEEYVLEGETLRVERRGVRVTIIDYSLSRMRIPDGAIMFNDLEEDPQLFECYDPDEPQFQVYRDMREVCGYDWKDYNPKTNVLWLLYLVDKLVFRCSYSRTRENDHKVGMRKLRQYRKKLESSSSAHEFVLANLRG